LLLLEALQLATDDFLVTSAKSLNKTSPFLEKHTCQTGRHYLHYLELSRQWQGEFTFLPGREWLALNMAGRAQVNTMLSNRPAR
jgi:hypothetical protein